MSCSESPNSHPIATRNSFRAIDALLEVALRIVIVYNASAGTALGISKVAPFVFVGVMSAWTVGYGSYNKQKGERMAAGSLAVAGAIAGAAQRDDREPGGEHQHGAQRTA